MTFQPAPDPRPAVKTLPRYLPGRVPRPGEGVATFKLSSNENPYPPLPGVMAAANRAAAEMNRYPDMGCRGLYSALSEHLGVPTDHLASGTGSVAVLHHLLQAFCESGDEVVYAWRSFEAYPIAVAVAGASSIQVPLTSDCRHNLKAMLAAITDKTKVVIVCTPNNPTGPAVTHTELEAFVSQVPPDVLIVVDEAYLEFVRSDDAVDGIRIYRDRRNVVLMRTFSKAYGLAGFRVGYLIAQPEVASAVNACTLPFGVSSVAQAAAISSIREVDELSTRVGAIVDERGRVQRSLREQGLKVPDTQGNFVWLPLRERASEFATVCEEAGVMVRPFPNEGVRVSVGTVAANSAFLSIAAKIIQTWSVAGSPN